MATIGSITVAFTADIGKLETGVESAIKAIESLSKSVEDVSKRLSETSKVSVEIKAKADTSEVSRASKEVEELESEIESKSPTVKVRVSGSLGSEFLSSTSAQIKEYGQSLKELGVSTGTALKSAASAATAIGGVLDGTNASVSGVITAVGRVEKSFGEWKGVLAGAAVATGIFVRYSGGLRTALRAATGDVKSTARIISSLGATAAASVVGIAAFASVIAVAKVASRGLSEEAKQNVARWSGIAAAAASGTAAIYAAGGAFAALRDSFRTSATSAEFVSNALRNASSSVASFAAEASRYVNGLVNVMTLARVASGEFRNTLAAMGSEAEGVRNLADRFGATVEEMLILQYAARAASVGMSQLARAQQQFYKNVGKVRIGQLGTQEAQEAKFAFDRLGISIDDLRNKTPQQVFRLVGQRLVDVKDAADRAAIAFDLFGRQAANVLPALKGLKEAEEDARRLGTTLSGANFSMFENVDTAFDRASEATSNFNEAMMISFAPLQAAAANAYAEIAGGLASAFVTLRVVAAAATAPFAVFIEVFARLLNIAFRLVGAVATVGAAFTDAAALGPAWVEVGVVLKGLLTYLESMVDVVADVASAFYRELNPALDQTATAAERLIYILQTFFVVIALGGVFVALGTAFNVSFWGVVTAAYTALTGFNWAAAFSGLITAMRFLLISSVETAQGMVGAFLLAGYGFISGFVGPFVSSVIAVITGNAAMATSSIATGITMAASLAIGTAGLTLIAAGIVAVIQNFDNLLAYFSDFGSNLAKLFTLEGLADAGRAVAEALLVAFVTVVESIQGFFGRLIRNIIISVRGIKLPEKGDASQSTAAEIIGRRQARQRADFEARMAAASVVGAPTDDIKMPVEDATRFTRAIDESRESMVAMSLNAAKFGETGRKAFLAAKADLQKLQQQVDDNTIEVKYVTDPDGTKRKETGLEAYVRRVEEIQGRLQENLKLADVISPEQFQQSAEGMRKAVEDAFSQVRGVMRGKDLGSDLTVDRFFPQSDEIKEQATVFAKSYEDSLIAIEQTLQSGGYGKGQAAMRAAEQAREQAKANFDRNMGKVEADVSFATEIRKALEDAFLTPVEKYQKKLREIQNNKSLSAAEKSLATVSEQKQMVESTFGKTAGQSYREKVGFLNEASRRDAYGRTAFEVSAGSKEAGRAREESERNKLAIERRKAAGLDATASQQLQSGAADIADIFDVTGLSMDEIRAKLSPKEFAEFQEAMKKNAQAAKESVGVQVPAVTRLAESQARLAAAVAEGVVTEEEASVARSKLNDEFMAAIGVTKTPFESFADSIENIAAQFDMAGKPLSEVRAGLAGNAQQLALFERSVKEARDRMLADLGIEKTPQQVFDEQMKKIDEAENSTDPEKRITREQATEARLAATRKRDEALGGESANDFGSRIAQQRRKIEEAYGKNGERDPEKFNNAMRKLNETIPGAEPDSPVRKFQEDLEKLKYSFKEGSPEFNQRKLMLQAQLQQDLEPALDNLKPDRRAIDGADVRSKAGTDTFFRILRGNDNPSLKAQLDVARNTRDLLEVTKNKDARPVLLQLPAR